jgi:hypothetical protein
METNSVQPWQPRRGPQSASTLHARVLSNTQTLSAPHELPVSTAP